MAKNISRKISLVFVFVILAACNSLKPGPTVMATRLMAELDGKLVMDGQCLRVDSDHGGSALLLWPPDFSVAIQGDTVRVTEGLVSGIRVEYDLQIGDQVHFAGGDAPYPIDPSFFQVSPTSCPGPYWIYGGLSENELKNKLASNQRGEIVRAVFLPGEKQVIVAWSYGVSLNSVDTGQELWYQAASAKILAFDVQPGGQLFAAALADGSVEVFSVNRGEVRRFGNPQPNADWGDIAWSPDGQTLAFQFIGDKRNDPISRLDVATGQIDPVPASQTALGVIPTLVWSPDGSSILVAALGEEFPRFVDIQTGEQRMRLAHPGGRISSKPLFLAGGKTLASEGPDGTVELLSYPDGALLRSLPGDARLLGRRLVMFPDAGSPLFVDPAGQWIADRGGYEPCYCGSGDIPSDYPLVVWNLQSGIVQAQLSQALPALASSHRLAALFDQDNIVMLYESGEITRWTFDDPRSEETMVARLEVPSTSPWRR